MIIKTNKTLNFAISDSLKNCQFFIKSCLPQITCQIRGNIVAYHISDKRLKKTEKITHPQIIIAKHCTNAGYKLSIEISCSSTLCDVDPTPVDVALCKNVAIVVSICSIVFIFLSSPDGLFNQY
jgi:hypothetical protein